MNRDMSGRLPATNVGRFRLSATYYEQTGQCTVRLLMNGVILASRDVTEGEIRGTALTLLRELIAPVQEVLDRA